MRKTLEQKQRSAKFYSATLPAAIMLTIAFILCYISVVVWLVR